MSRADRRLKRKEKRKARMAYERGLVERIDTVVRPYGCRISGIGASAVGVQGDARTYGISAVIRFPQGINAEQISVISTQVTNRVREVTRVLMDL